MIILLICTLGLSSAADVTSHLDVFIDNLGCKQSNTSPLAAIAPTNVVARKLSEYCSSYSEIANCIESKVQGGSGNTVALNFASQFNKDLMLTKSQELCTRLQDNSLAADLNCLQNHTNEHDLCNFLGLMDDLQNNPGFSDDLCSQFVDLRYCTASHLYGSCPVEAAEFMGNYVTVLSGSPQWCEQIDMRPPDGEYDMMAKLFQLNGSAILECGETLVDKVKEIFGEVSHFDLKNVMPKYEETVELICGQRQTIMSCLKKKMPDSTSALDQLVLFFVDLKKADTALEDLCSKRDVVKDNIDCLFSNETFAELKKCPIPDMMNTDLHEMGFTAIDYMCSGVVNMTECSGRVVTASCNKKLGDLLTSSTLGLLTQQCLHAKPRSIVPLFHPGWSYQFIPGGMVAMECISDTAIAMNSSLSREKNITNIFSTSLGIACEKADSIIDCLNTKLPKGTSRLDRMTREMIDLNKAKHIVASICPNREEIADSSECFFDQSLQAAQSKCMNDMTSNFIATTGGPGPSFVLVPALLEALKGFICEDGGGYKQWARCEADAVKPCSSKLAEYVPLVLTGVLKDKCGTEDGCTGPKCGASSIAVHGLVWFLVLTVLLRYM